MTVGTRTGQWRVDFDAEVVFSNGGALQTQGFRLDIPGDDISDAELGELLVRHLGLLMVGSTTITRKQLIQEPHKGSRGTGGAARARATVDLTGPGTAAQLPDCELSRLVDLPVVVVRLLGSADPVADRLTLAPYDVTGRAVVVHTGAATGRFVTEEAAEHLAERGAALVASDAGGPAPTALTEAGVPVLTGLAGLGALPPTGVRLHAVPFQGPDGAVLVRVYGVIDGG